MGVGFGWVNAPSRFDKKKHNNTHKIAAYKPLVKGNVAFCLYFIWHDLWVKAGKRRPKMSEDGGSARKKRTAWSKKGVEAKKLRTAIEANRVFSGVPSVLELNPLPTPKTIPSKLQVFCPHVGAAALKGSIPLPQPVF